MHTVHDIHVHEIHDTQCNLLSTYNSELTYYRHMYISSSIVLAGYSDVAITPRYSHSAVVFGSGASFRVVVLFGGNETALLSGITSETTLLLLREFTISATDLSTQASCCNIPHSPSTILLLFLCPAFLR